MEIGKWKIDVNTDRLGDSGAAMLLPMRWKRRRPWRSSAGA